MTTFHELLGTNDTMSVVEVKKRYKALSTRVHPDKGGNQVLMQMLTQSLKQVLEGNGSKEVFTSVAVDNDQTTELKIAKNRLEVENRRLREGLEKLNGQILTCKQDADEQSSLIKKLYKQHEKDIGELKASERNHEQASKQKERELVRLTAEYRAYREKAEHMLGQSPKRTLTSKRVTLGAMALLLLFVAGMPNKNEHVRLFLDGALPLHELPDNPVLSEQVKEEAAAEKAVSEVIEQIELAQRAEVYAIASTDRVGVWSNYWFEEPQRPYIAVQSEQGSYVVKGCGEPFYLFLNRPERPLDLSADFAYSHQEQQYFVYQIQTGKGSTLNHWFDSTNLLINGEQFANQQFTLALNRHQRLCLD